MNDWERQTLGLPLPDDINAIVMLFIGLAIIIVVVLWLLLPLAVFGIKARLDKSNQLAEQILQALTSRQPSIDNDITPHDGWRLCPACRQSNPANATYCSHCAEALPD